MRPPKDFKAPAPSQYQELVEWMNGRFQDLFEVAETLSYTNAALARVLKVSPKKFNKFAQQVEQNRKYIEALQAEAKTMQDLSAGIPRRKKSLWTRIKALFSKPAAQNLQQAFEDQIKQKEDGEPGSEQSKPE